jgi:hypothetical protein
MTTAELALWKKIKQFEMGDPNAEFGFADRLARENSWSLEYALRAMLEYKRFMFLICISDHPLTPSDQVDQVWHLHLLYTHSYWEDFCNKTLGRSVQHGPTKGGSDEKAKFNNWYEATKELYAKTFQKEQPRDLWPSSAVRFGQIRFTRVNLHTHWVLPKPKHLLKWKF